MTTLEQLARRYLEMMTSHDLTEAVALFSPDFTCWFGADGTRLDLAGWRGLVANWFAAFPDLSPITSYTIIDRDSDRFAVQMRWTATHVGTFMGLAGTGRRVENEGVSLFRVANELVVEEWIFEDVTNLMRQLEP